MSLRSWTTHDVWPEHDVDDRVPFLLEASRLKQGDSTKAQQLLGLITTELRGGRAGSQWDPISRARSRSEERPRTNQQYSCLFEQGRSATSSSYGGALSITTHGGQDRFSVQIATSRGYRGSGYINFSRPLSQIAPLSPLSPVSPMSPNAISGAPLDGVRPSQRVARDDIGLPRTPSLAGTLALAKPIFGRVVDEKLDKEVKREEGVVHPYQRRSRSRRWTSLPLCLKGFCKRRAPEIERGMAETMDERRRGKMPLTENNLRQYEVRQSPLRMRTSTFANLSPGAYEKRLPTPPSSPSEVPDSIDRPPPPPKKTPPESMFRTPSITPTLHVASAINFTAMPAICEVCREAKSPSAFPIRQCTTRCTHPPHTCISCVQKRISSCLQDKSWDQCVCPECGEIMEYEDVKFFATPEIFTRYDEQALRSALSHIPTFYYCLSPHCSSGQIHPWPLSSHPTFVCQACSHTYCLNHPSNPYHAGLSCPEYEAAMTSASPSSSIEELLQVEKRKMEEDGGRERVAKRTGRRCPNALCGGWIEKSEGCDYMVCWKCKWEFCWECGAGFERILRRGGKWHRRGCKYYG